MPICLFFLDNIRRDTTANTATVNWQREVTPSMSDQPQYDPTDDDETFFVNFEKNLFFPVWNFADLIKFDHSD